MNVKNFFDLDLKSISFTIFNAAQPGVGRVQVLGSKKKKKTFRRWNGLGHKTLG